MTREEERNEYANVNSSALYFQFLLRGMPEEEACKLSQVIKVALVGGSEWADHTMIDKACEWLNKNFNMPNDFESHFRKAMEE